MADKVEYPKYRHHSEQESFIVYSLEEHEALTPESEGWRDTPYPKGDQDGENDVHAETNAPVDESAPVAETPEEVELVSEVEPTEEEESSAPIETDSVSEGDVTRDSDTGEFTGEFGFSPEDGDQD